MEVNNDILDTSNLVYKGNFNSQVTNLLQHIRLTRDQVKSLIQLFNDLEGVLQDRWPGCKVIPFGSIVTGMGIKTSDVDCYISITKGVPIGRNIVVAARNILRKYPHLFQKVFAVVAARVPIVKLLHVPTNMNCDVNFKSAGGVQNSKLLAYLLHLDNRVFNLALLVKFWSKVHYLTGTNLTPSYALTLLVIFYLQLEKVLPPVIELQKNVPSDFIDTWNTAFDSETQYVTYSNKPLYHLFTGFFKFYSNFKFGDSIISVYEGRVLNRRDFEHIDTVSNIYYHYKENVIQNSCKPLRIDTPMCVQDPFDHSRNCTVAIFPKLAERLVSCFRSAAKACDEESSNSLLKVILTRDRDEERLASPWANKHMAPKKPTMVAEHSPASKVTKNKSNKKKVKSQFNLLFEAMNRKRKILNK